MLSDEYPVPRVHGCGSLREVGTHDGLPRSHCRRHAPLRRASLERGKRGLDRRKQGCPERIVADAVVAGLRTLLPSARGWSVCRGVSRHARQPALQGNAGHQSAVLLLLDIWPLGRCHLPGISFPSRCDGQPGQYSPASLHRLVLEKLPLAALSLVSVINTLLTQQEAMRSAGDQPSLTSRVPNALYAVTWYVSALFWPARL